VSAAEARAFGCRVVGWLNRNFVRSAPGRCLACGGGDRPHDVLLPHGTEPTCHARLHSRCWPAWHAARNAESAAPWRRWASPRRPSFQMISEKGA
jgi:hypothetical protein